MKKKISEMSISEMLENSKDGINIFFDEDEVQDKAVKDEEVQTIKGDLSMAQKRSLKEILKGLFDEGELEGKTPGKRRGNPATLTGAQQAPIKRF